MEYVGGVDDVDHATRRVSKIKTRQVVLEKREKCK